VKKGKSKSKTPKVGGEGKKGKKGLLVRPQREEGKAFSLRRPKRKGSTKAGQQKRHPAPFRHKKQKKFWKRLPAKKKKKGKIEGKKKKSQGGLRKKGKVDCRGWGKKQREFTMLCVGLIRGEKKKSGRNRPTGVGERKKAGDKQIFNHWGGKKGSSSEKKKGKKIGFFFLLQEREKKIITLREEKKKKKTL